MRRSLLDHMMIGYLNGRVKERHLKHYLRAQSYMTNENCSLMEALRATSHRFTAPNKVFLDQEDHLKKARRYNLKHHCGITAALRATTN